tara:strand:- start:2079 stop:2612 length:534 start_codon:yes stop_codon:yes gene_type:complete
MSTLKVNSIIPTGGVPTGGGGGIVQVKQDVKTDIEVGTTSGSTEVDICSVSITPVANVSKMLVSFSLSCDTSGNHNSMGAKLKRDSTDICIGDVSSSRTRCTIGLQADSVGLKVPSYSMCFLDDRPDGTSAITYKLVLFDGNTDGGSYFINRPSDGDTSSSNMAATSSLTVMEISDS